MKQFSLLDDSPSTTTTIHNVKAYSNMKKYEYKIDTISNEPMQEYLDLFGIAGWELVSIVTKPNKYICYFKREIQDN